MLPLTRLKIIAVCTVLAIITGIGMYYQAKKRWEAEYGAKAIEEVQQETNEVQEDAKERAKKVEQFKLDDYPKYWGSEHRLHEGDSGGGKAAPPGQAPPAKP